MCACGLVVMKQGENAETDISIRQENQRIIWVSSGVYKYTHVLRCMVFFWSVPLWLSGGVVAIVSICIL